MLRSLERFRRRWWSKRRASVSLVGFLAAVGLSAARPADRPCGYVVSYFAFLYQGRQLERYEWRIFDPSRHMDDLFLSLPAAVGPPGVLWDTTFTNAWFSAGDSLYRVEWRRGARPRFVTQLPAAIRRWWFNPDSGCWQGLRVSGEESADSPYYDRFRGELWQSTRDGATWRLVRADSVELTDPDDNRWRWSDGSDLGRELALISVDDLASETWDDSWQGKTAFIDTSTITVTKDDARAYGSDQWFFLVLKASPRRGIAFRHGEPGAPEHDWHGVDGPLYFVDLDRRSKTLIDGTDAFGMRSLVAEHCGFLLVPGVMGNALVIDSYGRKLLSKPSSIEAVWVRGPKP